MCGWGCGKKLLHLQSLRAHERIHADCNLSVCPHCGKGFGDAHNLRTHVRRVHHE